MIKRSFITLKLVRSFSLGFEILSPKWNGFCLVILLGCFHLVASSRGETFFQARNYWNG